MIKIANYMHPEFVAFLSSEARDAALTSLIDLVDAKKPFEDKEQFFNSIIDREKIVSTGIGMGVAIPHAKQHAIDNFFIAIGILPKGVEWNALDGAPVRLIFLIGGPDDKQTEYLQILSHLTLAIKDEERRKKMLTLNSREAIIELFKSF